MANNKNRPQEATVKAGALMCPVCCVEYIEVEVDFEYGNEVLRNVKMLRCPVCQEELFTPEQNHTVTLRMQKAHSKSKDKEEASEGF